MKKKNKGFTLVELLVVMAIIAILASIAVPNLATWIQRGRVTKAISEIQSMELALSAMLADTERSGLGDLFNPDSVRGYLDAAMNNDTLPSAARFQAAMNMYTRVTYALLRNGRGVLGDTSNDTELGIPYQNVLRKDLVRRLGTNYLPEIEFDAWGGLYNIYPGPWNSKDGPIVFRTYRQSTGSSSLLPGSSQSSLSDQLKLTSVPDPETGEVFAASFPANFRKSFYIWSNGNNLISSQAIYNPPNDRTKPADQNNPQYPLSAENYFDPNLELSQMGGGDDINNWDSGSSWSGFYN